MTTSMQTTTNELLAACLGCAIEDVTPEKHLIADLLADSVALMDIAMATEEQFQFIFDGKMMEGLETVSDLYHIIETNSTLYIKDKSDS